MKTDSSVSLRMVIVAVAATVWWPRQPWLTWEGGAAYFYPPGKVPQSGGWIRQAVGPRNGEDDEVSSLSTATAATSRSHGCSGQLTGMCNGNGKWKKVWEGLSVDSPRMTTPEP